MFFKTIVFLNAGAILALLTFIGSAPETVSISIELLSLKKAIFSFLVGILTMFAALAFSYAYTATNPTNMFHQSADLWVIKVNLALGGLAAFAFAAGVTFVLCGTYAN